MKRFVAIFVAILILLALLFAAYRFGSRQAIPEIAASAPAQRKALYWYDPMRPEQHFDKPGKSPFMDMALLPKYADDADVTGTVRIDPSVVQNLGLRMQVVQIGRLDAAVTVPATLAWDVRDARDVSARADAVVEHLYVRAPFEKVRKGQALAALLAPQWSAAAGEYFALADAHSADGRALRVAARERLRVLGMSDADIAALRPGDPRVTVRAPADGVVVELSVREGERVAAGTSLMRINGLDRVWLEAAVPQSQVAGIAAGTPVSVSVDAWPSERIVGRVDQVLPDVDAATRTQRVRIALDNPQHKLAPGMFAQVRIAAAAGEPHPLVPDDALIATGDETRVALALSDGRFRVVRVRTGHSAGGMTQVLAGLAGGERIVVSGQFLIDSEASLSGALRRLEGATATAHDAHPGRAGHQP